MSLLRSKIWFLRGVSFATRTPEALGIRGVQMDEVRPTQGLPILTRHIETIKELLVTLILDLPNM